MHIELRPAGDADRAFLRAVYASTRADELAMSGLGAEQCERFIDQQFAAQDHHYRAHYTGARFDLVLVDAAAVGRLYVARWAEEIRIMDIALLPAWRGRGIGTHLLRALLAEGEASGKTVSIHVEIFNPAQRLYHHLGFSPVSEVGVYRLMEWKPCRAAEAGTSTDAPPC